MTDTQRNKRPARHPDCVTEVRMGNTVLVVSGYFKEDTTATAADKMMKVLEAESSLPGSRREAPQEKLAF
ncbi:MAG: transposon-encoded TnpW family protein [Eisenbergiella sp.]|uniref:transposon-encoded TnpW family protein n=1 Tax=Clostridia TaxID=186801 RepID=UPI0015AD9A8C